MCVSYDLRVNFRVAFSVLQRISNTVTSKTERRILFIGSFTNSPRIALLSSSLHPSLGELYGGRSGTKQAN